MRKIVGNKGLAVALCVAMSISLASCGGKDAGKNATAKKSNSVAEWDQGTLSEAHSSSSQVVSDIFVNKVDGMTENIIKGMDVY